MNIYEFDDYREFLSEWITQQPGGGRGILKKWAAECSVHSTLLSQILSAKKEMSLELAERLAQSLELSESELDYFLLLVMHARAGTSTLRAHMHKKILTAKKRSETISHRLNVETEIGDTAKSTFYSSWIYSGVRNLAATKAGKSIEALADRLSLPRGTVQETVQFLLENGLCKMDGSKLTVGPRRTHVGVNSPHIGQHHQNWRLQGMQKMFMRRDQDLFFTFPMSLSVEDAEKIRRTLPSFIESIHKIVSSSESETVRSLNIDFFEY